MPRIYSRRAKALANPSDAVALVAAAALRLGMTKEDALAIAKAEPRGATVFAGQPKRARKFVPVRVVRLRSGADGKRKGPLTIG